MVVGQQKGLQVLVEFGGGLVVIGLDGSLFHSTVRALDGTIGAWVGRFGQPVLHAEGPAAGGKAVPARQPLVGLRGEEHAIVGQYGVGLKAASPVNEQLRILLECVDWCRRRPDLHLLTVGLDKRQAVTNTVSQDVWRQLLLLFDAHLAANPAGPAQGVVFCDNTNRVKLTNLMHTLRQPSSAARTLATPTLQQIIGDPVLWDSRTSYLHQMVDVIAYFAKQLFEPNRRVRAKGTHNYFHRLAPINLLLKQQGTSIQMV